MRPVLCLCLSCVLCGCHGIAHRFARHDACVTECVPPCPAPCQPVERAPRGVDGAETRRAVSQEVLLVPRVVYVPYVQQEAAGVVRVRESAALRSEDAGARGAMSEADLQRLEDQVRALEQQRDDLRRTVEDLRERGLRSQAPPPPELLHAPRPICPPPCPPR